MHFFEPAQFTATELDIIAKNLKHPSVVKYLKNLAQIAMVSIAISPKEDTEINEYVLKQEQQRGGIAMVETLLSLEEAKSEESATPQN